MRRGKLQSFGQEVSKLRLAHLARGHREFAVPGFAAATDMTVYRDVIWRIGKYGRGFCRPEKACIGRLVERIPATNAVFAEEPKIAQLRGRGSDSCREIVGVIGGFRGIEGLDTKVQLGQFETDGFDIEIEGYFGQFLEM